MMKKYFSITFIMLFFGYSLSAQTEKPTITKSFTIGEIVELRSEILNENRKLNIYLPPGYDKNKTQTFPVMYLLDGSADEDFVHIVGLLQFFNLTFAMPETIVVGIANVDRRRDFTQPTSVKEDKERNPTSGGSAKFIDFTEKELQPYIESHYRTGSTKYLLGQSLGGLIATEILLKKPHLFTNYLIVSASLWWNNESLFKESAALMAKQDYKGIRVYISVGTEGKIMEEDAAGIAKALKSLGDKSPQVDFVPMPEENHATILHLSIYRALQLLFPYKK